MYIANRVVIGLSLFFFAPRVSALPPDSDFIRVSPDHWTFEHNASHKKFIPFGSNLVLSSKEDLDIFGKRYDDQRYDRVLTSCEKLGINFLKVFLHMGNMLPDPQPSRSASIAEPYLENLQKFLKLCRKHHIRAVVALAEWGGNQCKWWQEGGQYFGQMSNSESGRADSLAVLVDFWKQLGTLLKNNPAVFSYSPCVEWSMPDGNLTWAAEYNGAIPGPVALRWWRAWLAVKYCSIRALNQKWHTKWPGFELIPSPTFAYDEATHQYEEPEAMLFDYQNFREWTTLRYFRPQIAAIRHADRSHMVTISNHMRQWDLWPGAAKYFMGFTAAEEKGLPIDYVTHHANFDETDLVNWKTAQGLVNHTRAMLRFCYAGRPAPIILEEFSFTSADPQRTAAVQSALVRQTIGHASGWSTWYLQYPENPNTADAAALNHCSAWLDKDFKLTPWGRAAQQISGQLGRAVLTRRKSQKKLKLDRRKELVPTALCTIMNVARKGDQPAATTDYLILHERDLDMLKPTKP